MVDEHSFQALDVLVSGGAGDDKIEAKRLGAPDFRSSPLLLVTGGSGDDNIEVAMVKSSGHLVGAGEGGEDSISGKGGEMTLYQNNRNNTPDGSKDILNCHGSSGSIVYIRLEDGDIALNCKIVITTTFPPPR